MYIYIDDFKRTAYLIRDSLGLSLFGFDVILPINNNNCINTNNITVIDVNFFPSYKEVRDFPFRFCKFLHDRANIGNL